MESWAGGVPRGPGERHETAWSLEDVSSIALSSGIVVHVGGTVLCCGRLADASTFPEHGAVEWVELSEGASAQEWARLDAVVLDVVATSPETWTWLAPRALASGVPLIAAAAHLGVDAAVMLGRAGVSAVWSLDPETLPERVAMARARTRDDALGGYRAQRRWEALMATLASPVWSVEAGSRGRRWRPLNPAARAFVGDDVSQLEAAYRSEVEYVVLEGRDRVFRLYASEPLVEGSNRDAAGERLVIAEEVTAQRRLEAARRSSQRLEAVGRLAGAVAHDFNNVLTVLATYSQFVWEDLPEDSPLRTDVDAIREAVQRGTVLASQLLGFVRAEEPTFPPLVLAEVIRSVDQLLRPTLPENVTFELAIEMEGLSVRADASRVERLLCNLATNAREAMHEGGTLTLAVRAEVLDEPRRRHGVRIPAGAFAVLRVQDTGVGMSAEVRARVFEPFFTTRPGEADGLGLATAYSIVKELRGHLTVDSAVGEGSTFEVWLPLVTMPVSFPSLRHRCVLFVGDEGRIEGLRERLAALDCDLATTSSAEGALRLAEVSLEVDALLVDLPAPVALPLVEQIRRQRPEVVAVVVGGEPTGETRVRAVANGASLETYVRALGDALSGT